MTDQGPAVVCAVCGMELQQLGPRLWVHVGRFRRPWDYHAAKPVGRL